MADMVIVGNVRYRYEDAKRLGLLPADGKVITAQSVDRTHERTTDAPANTAEHTAVVSTRQLNPTGDADGDKSTSVEKPTKSGTKADWTAYALANGKTEADLDGLKRDDIAALFDDAGDTN